MDLESVLNANGTGTVTVREELATLTCTPHIWLLVLIECWERDLPLHISVHTLSLQLFSSFHLPRSTAATINDMNCTWVQKSMSRTPLHVQCHKCCTITTELNDLCIFSECEAVHFKQSLHSNYDTEGTALACTQSSL